MDNETMELIAVLNKSLSYEYGALFMLPQHLAHISDPELKSKLRGIMEMELEHAEKTARLIFALGGKPNADLPNFTLRTTVKEILEAQLAGERQAIEIYDQAARLSKVPEHRKMLLDLMAEEEHHQEIVLTELAKLG